MILEGIGTICIQHPIWTSFLTAGLVSYYSYRKSLPRTGPDRPALVLDAISCGKPLYYFGVGSNLSRTHLENRSISGKKIDIISMEPCYIPGYRLAFNLRGIPPMEPAMGSLEQISIPSPTSGTVASGEGVVPSKPLKAYERAECHGSLIQLSPEAYETVYRSEGGHKGAVQSYEEIVVTCIPYDKSKPPVQAVAYSARNHTRLVQDVPPSLRYMTIIRNGAKELGLKTCYQEWLEDHPVQKPCSNLLKKVSKHSMVFYFTSIMIFQSRFISFVQCRLLEVLHLIGSKWMPDMMYEAAACMILFPTAFGGVLILMLMEATGKTPPPLKKFMAKSD